MRSMRRRFRRSYGVPLRNYLRKRKHFWTICTCVLVFLIILLWGLRSARNSSPKCEGTRVIDEPWTSLHQAGAAPKLSDLVVHRKNAAGEVTKVLFMTLSNKMSSAVCHNVGSAYLSGVPIAVAAYDIPFSFQHKIDYAEQAAEDAGLRESDVVVYMDSDTLFTGMDPFDFIDRFINTSPDSLEKLNGGAVRNGTAMAPYYTSAEEFCSAWSTMGDGLPCKMAFRSLKKLMTEMHAKNLRETNNYSYDVKRFDETQYSAQYINSGVVVTRLWALRMVNKAVKAVVASGRVSVSEQIPLSAPKIEEQSCIQLLYYDLLLFELNSGTLVGKPTVESHYGLRGGMIDFDFVQEISVLPWRDISSLELSLRKWGTAWRQRVMTQEEDSLAVWGEIAYDRCASHERMVKFLHPYLRSMGVPSKQHNFTVGTTTYTSILTPPIFARRYQERVGHVYPFVRHYPAGKREERMFKEGPSMAWGVPILFDAAARRNAHSMLRSVQIVTHSPGKTPTVRAHNFTDMCPFLFSSWGLHPLDA